MSSNGRLLRKLRRIMGIAVASSSLVACSSQISYGKTWTVGSCVFDLDNKGELTISTLNGVTAYFPKNFPKGLIKENVKSVLIGEGIIDRHMVKRETFKGWTSLEKIYFCGSDEEITIDKIKPELNKNADEVQVTFDQVTGTLSFSGNGVIDNSWKDKYDRGIVEFVIVQEGVTDIGNDAFEGCKKLKNVVVPASVKNLGNFAFAGCSELKEIKLPDTLESIGSFAFCRCKNLKAFTVSPHVKMIGIDAFAECEKLKELTILGPIENIPAGFCRECKSLKEIKIPLSIGRIGYSAFSGCESLSSVKFFYPTENAKPILGPIIQPFAFKGCKNLREIYLPSNVRFDIERKDIGYIGIQKIIILSGSKYKLSRCDNIDEFFDPHTRVKVNGE